MEFHEQNPQLRDRYEIVTFHGAGAKTFSELAPHLEKLEKEVWKRSFPFPILLDSTEQTTKQWGIMAYPTVVLIDPEGRVVRGGNLNRLKKELGVTD
jgi:peroxiredoxin